MAIKERYNTTANLEPIGRSSLHLPASEILTFEFTKYLSQNTMEDKNLDFKGCLAKENQSCVFMVTLPLLKIVDLTNIMGRRAIACAHKDWETIVIFHRSHTFLYDIFLAEFKAYISNVHSVQCAEFFLVACKEGLRRRSSAAAVPSAVPMSTSLGQTPTKKTAIPVTAPRVPRPVNVSDRPDGKQLTHEGDRLGRKTVPLKRRYEVTASSDSDRDITAQPKRIRKRRSEALQDRASVGSDRESDVSDEVRTSRSDKPPAITVTATTAIVTSGCSDSGTRSTANAKSSSGGVGGGSGFYTVAEGNKAGKVKMITSQQIPSRSATSATATKPTTIPQKKTYKPSTTKNRFTRNDLGLEEIKVSRLKVAPPTSATSSVPQAAPPRGGTDSMTLSTRATLTGGLSVSPTGDGLGDGGRYGDDGGGGDGNETYSSATPPSPPAVPSTSSSLSTSTSSSIHPLTQQQFKRHGNGISEPAGGKGENAFPHASGTSRSDATSTSTVPARSSVLSTDQNPPQDTSSQPSAVSAFVSNGRLQSVGRLPPVWPDSPQRTTTSSPTFSALDTHSNDPSLVARPGDVNTSAPSGAGESVIILDSEGNPHLSTEPSVSSSAGRGGSAMKGAFFALEQALSRLQANPMRDRLMGLNAPSAGANTTASSSLVSAAVAEALALDTQKSAAGGTVLAGGLPKNGQQALTGVNESVAEFSDDDMARNKDEEEAERLMNAVFENLEQEEKGWIAGTGDGRRWNRLGVGNNDRFVGSVVESEKTEAEKRYRDGDGRWEYRGPNREEIVILPPDGEVEQSSSSDENTSRAGATKVRNRALRRKKLRESGIMPTKAPKSEKEYARMLAMRKAEAAFAEHKMPDDSSYRS